MVKVPVVWVVELQHVFMDISESRGGRGGGGGG